jgi:hypothetical protein
MKKVKALMDCYVNEVYVKENSIVTIEDKDFNPVVFEEIDSSVSKKIKKSDKAEVVSTDEVI